MTSSANVLFLAGSSVLVTATSGSAKVVAQSWAMAKSVHAQKVASKTDDAAGTCSVASASAKSGEFEQCNAYTADGEVHKTSVCRSNKGPWAQQSKGNVTVKQCAQQAKKMSAKCWDFMCEYKLKLGADCQRPVSKLVKPAAGAVQVAAVGDSITAGYLSSCGLTYDPCSCCLHKDPCSCCYIRIRAPAVYITIGAASRTSSST